MVEILMSDTELRQTLIENYLKRVPDLQKIEWRFIKKKANLQVCTRELFNKCAIRVSIDNELFHFERIVIKCIWPLRLCRKCSNLC